MFSEMSKTYMIDAGCHPENYSNFHEAKHNERATEKDKNSTP